MALPGRFSCNIEGQHLSRCIAYIIRVFIDVVPMCMSLCGVASGTAPGVPHPAAEHLWGGGGARLGGG